MMHVDPATRVRMLREFRRVSRRWVIVDYRHKYTFRYVLTHTFGKLGLGRSPLSRVSSAGLREEFRAGRLQDRRSGAGLDAAALGQVGGAGRKGVMHPPGPGRLSAGALDRV